MLYSILEYYFPGISFFGIWVIGEADPSYSYGYPLLMDKLRDKENFIGILLYQRLQPDSI